MRGSPDRPVGAPRVENRRTPSGRRSFSSWLLVSDAGAVLIGWTLSLMTRGPGHGELGLVPGTVLVVAAIVGTVATLAAQDLYRSWPHLNGPVALARILRSAVIGVVAVLCTAWFVGIEVSVARAVIGGLWTLVVLLVGRWVAATWVRRCRRQGRFVSRILLVGSGDSACQLWRHIASRPDSGRRIVGYVGDRSAGMMRRWVLPWLGEATDAVAVAEELDLDGIVIAHGAVTTAQLNVIVRGAHTRSLDVELSEGLSHLDHRRLITTDVAHEPVLFVEPPHTGRIRDWAKRSFDLIGGGLILVIVSPLFIAVAVAMALSDGRPIFYRQLRVGKDRRPFRLWKFRTMVPDADQHEGALEGVNERCSGPLFKLVDDPRTTRLGRLLRATSIDELPQLFNVLTGAMSLVGPRPALPSEVADFDAELKTRSRVKPGMTGLWQIEARDNPEFYAYRQLDLFYVENWSVTLDVAILLSTVPCLIRHARFEQRNRSGSTVQAGSVRFPKAASGARASDVDHAARQGVGPDGTSLVGIEPR